MQLFRCGLDKFEEPLAPRRDMSTVLDIGGRPETLGHGVVPLVEERVERLQDERFVLCFGRGHGFTPLGLSSGDATPDTSSRSITWPKRGFSPSACAGPMAANANAAARVVWRIVMVVSFYYGHIPGFGSSCSAPQGVEQLSGYIPIYLGTTSPFASLDGPHEVADGMMRQDFRQHMDMFS